MDDTQLGYNPFAIFLSINIFPKYFDRTNGTTSPGHIQFDGVVCVVTPSLLKFPFFFK